MWPRNYETLSMLEKAALLHGWYQATCMFYMRILCLIWHVTDKCLPTEFTFHPILDSKRSCILNFLLNFSNRGHLWFFFFSECLTYCTLAHRLGSIHQSSNYLLNQSSSWCSQSFNVTYKAHIKQIVGKECLC